MRHMSEIGDPDIRDAIDLFQTEMELWLLNLLSKDRDIALAQINAARNRMLDAFEKSRVEGAEDRERKTLRVAFALLEKSFDRMAGTIEERHDDGTRGQSH
jgi:hypothetical protein